MTGYDVPMTWIDGEPIFPIGELYRKDRMARELKSEEESYHDIWLEERSRYHSVSLSEKQRSNYALPLGYKPSAIPDPYVDVPGGGIPNKQDREVTRFTPILLQTSYDTV